MDEYISNLMMMVNTLGHKLFEEIKENSELNENDNFSIEATRGANEKGIQTQEGFVVLKESKIAHDYVSSYGERSIAKRNDLIQSEKVAVINDEFIVMEDLLFSCPSAVADIVLGRSANGLTDWKNSQRKTLKRHCVLFKIIYRLSKLN